MKLYFDPELLIEPIGPSESVIYSPAIHRWVRVDEAMKVLITLIVQRKGRIDPGFIAGEMTRNGCEVDSAQVVYQAERLVQSGLFFESEEAFRSTVLDVKNQYAVKDDQEIEIVYLHPTLRCNFRCWYCYNQNAPAQQGELSTGQWVDIIQKLMSHRVRAVIFTGGEVLLREDLEQILGETRLGQVHTEVLTNGSLLKNRLPALLTLVDKVIISLDSLDPQVNALNRSPKAFADIIAALEEASRINPAKVSVRAVVTRQNQRQVNELKQVLHDKYGIQTIESWFIPNSPDEVELVPQMDDAVGPEVGEIPVGIALGGYRCGAASNTIAVSPDGGVYPCQSLLLDEFRITSILGDTWHDDLLKSEVRRQFRGLSVEKMGQCGACSYRYFCGGGCPAISYKVYGKLASHLDYFCGDLRKAARNRLIYGKVEWQDLI